MAGSWLGVMVLAAWVEVSPAHELTPTPAALQKAADTYFSSHLSEVLTEFGRLLSLPNHASNRSDIERNAELIRRMLDGRGFRSELWTSGSALPAVYGELKSAGAHCTLLVYAHYDGQPVDPATWRTPPYRPTLQMGPRAIDILEQPVPAWPAAGIDAWRLFARSSGDDKAPIQALLAALDVLSANHLRPGCHIKVFFEGEEEIGSPQLRGMLSSHAGKLRSDLTIFADGPVHQSGRPQVIFGVRGIQALTVTVFGPLSALHSGHYGNWAPNPIIRLSDLLLSMRSPSAQILIAGAMQSVVQLPEPNTDSDAAGVDATLLREQHLQQPENPDWGYFDAVTRPALNVLNISAGGSGPEVANAIPSEASASLDFRLVPNQTPGEIRRLTEAHIVSRGFRVVTTRQEVEAAMDRDRIALLQWKNEGYAGYSASPSNPAVSRLVAILKGLQGPKLVEVRALGGTLPLSIFAESPGIGPIVLMPIANHDDNQHAANENLRIQNLQYGIEAFTAVFGAIRLSSTGAP